MSVNNESAAQLTNDGGLIAAPPTVNTADSTDGSSIRIPSVDTSLGADFGEEITDDNREFASQREPVAGFLIFGFSADVIEKWFSINDVETKQPDPKLDKHIQKELRTLKFKSLLQTFEEYKRLYGNVLAVGSFDDAEELPDLQNEKADSAVLKHLAVFPKNKYSVAVYDEDPKSFRYGLPTVYQVQNGKQSFRVHWTRCFEKVGKSVLDLIWDDLTCGRNIRWGVGQWVYRTGGGFAVIKYPKEWSPDGVTVLKTTPAKIQEWSASTAFRDITHRNYIAIINELMDFKFEGAQSATLNPEPFFDTNLKQISIATGIPKSILEGAEAGALTGSEKNDQQYYKKISGEQSKLEDFIRWVIDQVLRQTSGVKTVAVDSVKSAGSVLKRLLRKVAPTVVKDVEEAPIDYDIEWANAFQLGALDEARVELTHEQANEKKLLYRSIDEVREDEGLKPLPSGEGASLKKAVAANPQEPSQQQQTETPEDAEALPNLGILIQPILKQVVEGVLPREVALQQGLAMVEFYVNLERERALEYNRQKFSKSDIPLSPEQELEFADEKSRYIKEFMMLLEQAEKLAKKKAA